MCHWAVSQYLSSIGNTSLLKIQTADMTYKFKINQVRQILGLEVKLESSTLEDGTIVNYERLESGFPIFMEDGVTPLAEGEYKLEDGTVVKVDAEGLIVEVVPPVETPEVPETEVEVEMADPVPAAEDETKTEDPKGEEDKMTKIQEDVKTVMEAVVALADEVAKLKEQIQMAEEKVREFAKSPATTRIPKVSVPSDSKEDRMASTIEIIKQAMKK